MGSIEETMMRDRMYDNDSVGSGRTTHTRWRGFSGASGPLTIAGTVRPLLLAASVAGATIMVAVCGGSSDDTAAEQNALVEQGKQIFRFDTFGDEARWTDTLKIHEVIGTAVDPITALSVGLKVDAEALPQAVVDGIRDGSVDLASPATTVALLKLGAVVGLNGTVETVGGTDRLVRVGRPTVSKASTA